MAAVADRGAYARGRRRHLRGARRAGGLVKVLSDDRHRPAVALGADVRPLRDRAARSTSAPGLALCTDGVGSKVIVAEQAGRYDTVGIDCIAMNVNDVICVGAEPIALVDYIAVEEARAGGAARRSRSGCRRGAEQARIEIPGGELAQLPELIKGHPSPNGFDLVRRLLRHSSRSTRSSPATAIAPGDALIGIPSSGVHSNGLTLARSALLTRPRRGAAASSAAARSPTSCSSRPSIYVRAVLELLALGRRRARPRAHHRRRPAQPAAAERARSATGSTRRCRCRPSSTLIAAARQRRRDRSCGRSSTWAAASAWSSRRRRPTSAVELLARHHPGTAVIGSTTDHAGLVELPQAGLAGRKDEGFRAV